MSMTRSVPQRISVVDAAGPLILYLVLMVMQYFVASPRFFRAVSPDPFSRDNLIAVNVAAMTGVLLVVLAWLSAGDHPWGARLSGASRLTIACSSYVGTLAVITTSSVQWWAIIALQPSSSPLGTESIPRGCLRGSSSCSRGWPAMGVGVSSVAFPVMRPALGGARWAMLLRSRWDWSGSLGRSRGWLSRRTIGRRTPAVSRRRFGCWVSLPSWSLLPDRC